MQRFTLRIIAFCFVWSNFESAAIFSFSCWQLNRKTCLQNVKLENARHQLFVGVSGVGCHTSPGRGRHWNFDPLQCLGPRPEILDRYISLSCLRWLPTACHERLAYFHWPQWVTWLVTWWVTWSRSPDAGRHIGKFSLWTTLLRFSRSAQISLFSNFTKLGQLFFDNIFFGLTS